MFTGIVREVGLIHGMRRSGGIYKLDVRSMEIYKGVDIGDSIAVNGVCLTITRQRAGILSFDVMPKTVHNTNLAGLKNNDMVNMEGALKASGKLNGHFMLGHVDCVGTVERVAKKGDDFAVRVSFPDRFRRFIVDKGSIAIDGVSLTISDAEANFLEVHLIPYTLKSTTLGIKQEADKVNLEFDILGKYVMGQLDVGKRSCISEELLRNKGFI